MFEHRREPLLPPEQFLKRLLRHFGLAVALVAGSLALGVIGYHVTEGLDWLDALENASMLLGGMGPVDEMRSTAGKLFASFYALYSGLLFLVSAGVVFAPIIHRYMHRFHLETEDE
jgi:hypothetical protein